MALSTASNSGGPLLTPQQVGDLVVTPMAAESVAMRVTTLKRTASNSYRVPLIVGDPSASWTAEGAEITPSDIDPDEIVITPKKLAALSIITNEMANDGDPSQLEEVGRGMARDCAKRVDAAFFSTVAAPAPTGLSTLSGVQSVTNAAAFASLDYMTEAASLIENVGGTCTAFVTTPAVALALAKLKKATGSLEPLLAVDPAQPSRRLAAGVPIWVSPYVAANTMWALDGSRIVTVLRQDIDVQADKSAKFTSDQTAVRTIMRLAFGFPHAAAVVKIATA